VTHVGATGQEKGHGKKVSDHAPADQTRKGNSSRAYSARASAAAISTTAAFSTKYTPAVETK
jgi:hypothetical protein